MNNVVMYFDPTNPAGTQFVTVTPTSPLPVTVGGFLSALTVAGAAGQNGTGLAVGLPLWSTSDLTQLRINNAAAAGDTILVAAVAGQTTKVYRLRINVAGATIVQIKDGATVLEVFNFAANGGAAVFDLSDRPYYKTTANTALVLNSSNAVQVDGMIEYIRSA